MLFSLLGSGAVGPAARFVLIFSFLLLNALGRAGVDTALVVVARGAGDRAWNGVGDACA